MRAVIQRVSRASVTIQNTVKSRIEKGLLVLLAVEEAMALRISNGSAARSCACEFFRTNKA